MLDVCRCQECGRWLVKTEGGWWTCLFPHMRLVSRDVMLARLEEAFAGYPHRHPSPEEVLRRMANPIAGEPE